ncbi:MAG: methyltransferase domain-containing protein [Geobacter sp.]|nr:methyltransferase domain-containing protein [Geobacter sp.]
MSDSLTWFYPTLEQQAAAVDLSRLIVAGAITDPELQRRQNDLARYYRNYLNTCPVPTWAPGLVLTNEIRRVTDTFLPFNVIKGALLRLVHLALRQGGELSPPLLQRTSCWPDLLHHLQRGSILTNPAAFLGMLMDDQHTRMKFLFALYLPQQFGGGFGRYPGQYAFLRQWLGSKASFTGGALRCLDAACGSGEGTYELARLVRDAGFPADAVSISGVTLSPLEVFSASHARFPHDPVHENIMRQYLDGLTAGEAWGNIRFAAADLQSWEGAEQFQVILCNGVLGGPLLHDAAAMEAVVRRLVRCLAPGGILLAADRFHAGWRKVVPSTQLESLFCSEGLSLVQVGEGIGGIKPSGG